MYSLNVNELADIMRSANSKEDLLKLVDKKQWENCLYAPHNDTHKVEIILNTLDMINKVLENVQSVIFNDNFMEVYRQMEKILQDIESHKQKKDYDRHCLYRCQVYLHYDLYKKIIQYLLCDFQDTIRFETEPKSKADKRAELIDMVKNTLIYMGMSLVEYANKNYY